MPWTDDKVARLRELWDEGLPTSQIGKLLDFTKNAVVGKAHRIGLERRPSPIKRSMIKPDRKKVRAPLMPKLNFSLETDNDFNKHNDSKNLINNKYFSKDMFISNNNIGCEWPFGHPNEISFHYCGEKKLEGKPYCNKHCEHAYILPEKLKSDEAAA